MVITGVRRTAAALPDPLRITRGFGATVEPRFSNSGLIAPSSAGTASRQKRSFGLADYGRETVAGNGPSLVSIVRCSPAASCSSSRSTERSSRLARHASPSHASLMAPTLSRPFTRAPARVRREAAHSPELSKTVVGAAEAAAIAPPDDSSNVSKITEAANHSSAALQELRIARTKAEAGLHTQALVTLRDLVAKHPGTGEALEAYFNGVVHGSQSRSTRRCAYLEIGERTGDFARARSDFPARRGDATVLPPTSRHEARQHFATWSATIRTAVGSRALLAKGDLEERAANYELDTVLAPSSFGSISYAKLQGLIRL